MARKGEGEGGKNLIDKTNRIIWLNVRHRKASMDFVVFHSGTIPVRFSKRKRDPWAWLFSHSQPRNLISSWSYERAANSRTMSNSCSSSNSDCCSRCSNDSRDLTNLNSLSWVFLSRYSKRVDSIEWDCTWVRLTSRVLYATSNSFSVRCQLKEWDKTLNLINLEEPNYYFYYYRYYSLVSDSILISVLLLSALLCETFWLVSSSLRLS